MTPVDGLVTVIVPVALLHVGCTAEAVGTEGGVGALNIAETDVDSQADTSSLTFT